MPEVLDAFDEVARGAPDALAVMAADGTLTYAALRDASVQLAQRMTDAGARSGDVVALSLGRTAAHVIAILAAWRIGAAFLPIDPSSPAARTRACITESRARLWLRDGLVIDVEATADGGPHGQYASLAYVVYTSGSTGRPKGVRVSHHGLLPVLSAQIAAFGLGPGKRALLYVSTAFDASLSDIGTALLSGATLVIPARPPTPRELAAYLAAFRITHADLPPSLLPLVDVTTLPACLETVVIGGEVAAPEIVRAWARVVRVINVYGPTETTICTSLCECDAASWDKPLLGAPLPHVAYRVVDGELWIAGPALALGYVNRPAIESQRFVVEDGARYYRTGDRVRGDDVRQLEFVGRIDRQVKIRGLLVSPEEIEAALRGISGVTAAAVVVEADGARSALVAHVVTAEGCEESAASLRERLAASLPRWMLPRIVLADALERGVTGKIDTAKLVRAVGAGPRALSGPLEPDGDVARATAIAAAFAAVLGKSEASLDDDFFALGGDSLAAFEVSSLAGLAGVTVEASAILDARTPSAIARTGAARGRSVAELDALAESVSARLPPASHDGDAKPAGDWLLTGATGFLGRRLLAGLLARTDATVHCLVRSVSSADVADLGDLSSRVVLHIGDVSAPHLGLPLATWRHLAGRVGHVVHAAAAVNLALPFEALAPTNIGGTAHVVELVRTGAPKRLTYLSTLSVLVATAGGASRIDERTCLGAGDPLFGAYAQTKWVAESLVRRAVPDAWVIRPGLLTGDSTTGAPAARCTLAAFVRGLAALGAIPEGDASQLRVDVTPVDHAAAVILDLTLSSAPPRVVHVASEAGATLEALLRALRRRRSIAPIAADEFVQRARATLSRDRAMTLASASYRLLGSDGQRDADLFLHTGRAFDCSLATSLTGRVCPPADDALLSRYLDAALAGEP